MPDGTDLTLPPIGFGTYGLDPEPCERAVRTALEAGYRHVDTAQMYDNEAAVGAALAAADVPREAVTVATKARSQDLAPDALREAAHASRDRLGVETIDLYYVHWPINAYRPAETLPVLDELRDAGVIRHVGVSNFTPAQVREAMDVLGAPLAAHQVECHVCLPQGRLVTLAREHGHHLVAYSPLAKGLAAELPALEAIADRLDATPAQVAIAWLLKREGVVTIPRSSSPAHIRENLASRSVHLDEAARAAIAAIDRTERVVDFPGAPWNEST